MSSDLPGWAIDARARCDAHGSPLLFYRKRFWLRRLRYNGWRIAQALALSRATVSRILRRAGMNRLRSLDPPPPMVRYEHQHPGDLIHFDSKRLARIVKPGHRVHGDRTRETRSAGYEYLHIDDPSRISFAAILPDQTHCSAIRFFHRTRAHFSRFGFTCRRFQTALREWPTPAPTRTPQKENCNSIPGSTTTTSTGPMLASTSTHQPLAQA